MVVGAWLALTLILMSVAMWLIRRDYEKRYPDDVIGFNAIFIVIIGVFSAIFAFFILFLIHIFV